MLGFLSKSGEAPPPAATEEASPVRKSAPSSAGGDSAGPVRARTGSSRAIEDAPSSGPYASQAGRREIERSAEIVLATEPDEIRAATGKVFDAVHAADGIVLSSSVRDGESPRRRLRAADPIGQPRRRARLLLADRGGPLPQRGDPGHHRADRRRRRKAAGRAGDGAEPARRARRRRHRRGAGRRRSAAAQRAPPGRGAALAPLLAGAARQLLPRLAADRDRLGPCRRARTGAPGESPTASTAPAGFSPSPPG